MTRIELTQCDAPKAITIRNRSNFSHSLDKHNKIVSCNCFKLEQATVTSISSVPSVSVAVSIYISISISFSISFVYLLN